MLTGMIFFIIMSKHTARKIMSKKTIPEKQWTKRPDSARLIRNLKQLIATADISRAMRLTYDEMYAISGQKEYGKLNKSDKCYLGNIAEKHILKALGLNKNEEESGPDTTVDGVLMDIKTSSSSNLNNEIPKTHQIPRKHVGEHILIVCCNDYTNTYQIGVLKADKKMLRPPPKKRTNGGPGQDGKRGINALGYASTVWLKKGKFPKNKNLHPDNKAHKQQMAISEIKEALSIPRGRIYSTTISAKGERA